MGAQLDEEFRDFMQHRWPAMVRLAYALTGDQGHAEDVAQAAFARAFASWPKIRRTGNPEAYVRRIVINENRNRFRKQRVPTLRHADAEHPVASYSATVRPPGPHSPPGLIKVRLGTGSTLTLHPATVWGVRMVAFAIPIGAPVVSATAYSGRGEIATAIPFNAADGMAFFGTWLRPGQHGLARASGRIGSGSYLGRAWSATAYLGPWGVCLVGQAGTGTSSCMHAISAAGLGTGVMFWTDGVPAVAVGSAGQSVARIMVTSPDGKTMQMRLVMVGGIKFFAFPFGKGPKPWKWTAYDGSGHVIASDKVPPAA
jgi:Sigma-70 region 2